MKYPFWLPKPRRHWLKAIELLLLSIPVCFILRLTFYMGITASLPQILSGESSPSPLFIAWLIFCIFFPSYVFAHTYEFFHDEARDDLPDWIPRPRCIVNGFAYWIIFLLGVLIAGFAWLDYEIWSNSNYILETREEYIRRISPFLTITWIVAAAYLFYLKDGIFWFVGESLKLPGALLGRKQRRKKEQKSDIEKQ